MRRLCWRVRDRARTHTHKHTHTHTHTHTHNTHAHTHTHTHARTHASRFVNPTIWTDKLRATTHLRRGEDKRGIVLARWGGLGNHRYQVRPASSFPVSTRQYPLGYLREYL